MEFQRVTKIAHDLIAARLRPGDHAVDATVGKGHDTLFLARCVGPDGRVDGFDIQSEAISATGLRVAGLPQVRLHCLGHERMGEVVAGPIDGVMFNLGYLPSGDRGIVTRPDTTLIALKVALGLLSLGGLLTVVFYPEHEDGRTESEAVEAEFRELDAEVYLVNRYRSEPLLPTYKSPYLLVVERKR